MGAENWNDGWVTSISALTFTPQGLGNGTSSLPLHPLVVKREMGKNFLLFSPPLLHFIR